MSRPQPARPSSKTSPAGDLEAAARTGSALQRIRARVPTYLTDLKENPAWLPMFVLARTMAGRRLHWMATGRATGGARMAPRAGPTLFAGVDVASAIAALRGDGISTGIDLPDEIHRGIRAFAEQTPCFGNFDRRLPFSPLHHSAAEAQYGRPLLSGHYFERVEHCAEAMALARDPLLEAIATGYLGRGARRITTRIWWSFPTPSASEQDKTLASLDKYHFDLDDWRMLKFFFYLVPVDEATGPHVFVRGSHRRRALRHQLTLLVGHAADDVLSVYGTKSPVTITGPAGAGFVEDPFGFHMGTVPAERPRLMMEVGFGVSRPSKRRFHGEPVVR